MLRLSYQFGRPLSADEVRESAEKMIATMRTDEHEQTTYVDSMERAMATTDEAIENGDWNIIQTSLENPFVIADAPVVSWHRLANGTLTYGFGMSTPDVEVVLPVASTTCLHILPAVQRTRRVRQPLISEINRAEAAFATKYCYGHKNDPAIDSDLQPMFGLARIGINACSVRHRNYNDTMFEILMNGGRVSGHRDVDA